MTDDADGPPASTPRVWFLVGAIAIVVITIGVVGAITWTALDSSDDTEGPLDTGAAADSLQRTVDAAGLAGAGSATLGACPAGPLGEVLGRLAEALGGGDFATIIATGELTASIRQLGDAGPAAAVIIECGAEADEPAGLGELGLIVSSSPLEALDALRQGPDGWAELGASRGGRYLGRCGGGDCAVLWHDDELLAAIGGTGPVFDDVGTEQVQAALAAYLPSLVGALAGR